jgi:hypothetical protein
LKNNKNNRESNPEYDGIEDRKVKQLLDNMLDFLAEMPVDKYHDYREFRNLHLREYLIHRFIKNSAGRSKRRKNY